MTAAGISAVEDLEGSSLWDLGEVPFKNIVEQPASRFVKTKQRWCERFVAESYGKNKNIEKGSKKPPFNIIKNALLQRNSKLFSTKDVVIWTDALDKTDGSLQNKVLSMMVCMGIIGLRHIKFKDKNRKEKFRYVFILKESEDKCPHLKNGKCEFDWDTGATTDYFPKEYKEIKDTI